MSRVFCKGTAVRAGEAGFTCLLVVAALLFQCFTRPVLAQISFQDVSAQEGINNYGLGWGAAWGDFNSDHFPDLWITNHVKSPRLYVNNGGGSFSDVAASVVNADLGADHHGAAWADFNNDGFADLIQTVGAQSGQGSGANQLLVNSNGMLVDEAAERGITYETGRGRTPLWFDWDNDGFLDLLLANMSRLDMLSPSALFSQRNGLFVDESQAVGFDAPGPAFLAQITGVQGGDLPMLMVHSPKYPQRVYDYSTQPFQEISSPLGLSPFVSETVQDVAIADFDNNLEPDLLLVSSVEWSDFELVDANNLRSHFTVKGEEQGIEIHTGGDLTITLTPDFILATTDIFLGSSGINPIDYSFTVSVSDPDHEGWMTHIPGVDSGLFVGRDPVEPVWRIYLSTPDLSIIDLEIQSSQAISTVNEIGFIPFDGRQADTLMLRHGGVYSDASNAAGLTGLTPCNSVAVADFDNDADVDIYMGCSKLTGNAPNLLLENLGNAQFQAVPLAGGAEGTTTGKSESVIVADYDVDGFVDIFVANGNGFGAFSPGPDQLFRNQGNGNNWLEIDLEGVNVNRDGIGARVIAVSGTDIQMREQSGGIHRFSQNDSRLHFGLKDSTSVDALIIKWPNGIQQGIPDLPANQLVRIVEPSSPGREGQPLYVPGSDRGVYLWHDAGDDLYHLRVSGDSNPSAFTVNVVSVAPVQEVTPSALEGDDQFTRTTTGFTLNAFVDSEEDAVDFRLFAGAPAMISIERDGVRDPRDLHVGASGLPMSPSGWIVGLESLPALPAFTAGEDLGLFIGRNSNTVSARWNADSMPHQATVLMMSSELLVSQATAVSQEAGDNLLSSFFAVIGQGSIEADFDGFDVDHQPGSLVGLVYFQDGLFQSHRANPGTQDLGKANAYLLN